MSSVLSRLLPSGACGRSPHLSGGLVSDLQKLNFWVGVGGQWLNVWSRGELSPTRKPVGGGLSLGAGEGEGEGNHSKY